MELFTQIIQSRQANQRISGGVSVCVFLTNQPLQKRPAQGRVPHVNQTGVAERLLQMQVQPAAQTVTLSAGPPLDDGRERYD